MQAPDREPMLFTPITLRGVTIKNRIVISPMCQYSGRDGMASDWHVVHLGHFATGGAGLIFTEAAAVEERGRITHGDIGVWDSRHVAPLARVVDFIKRHGAVAAIQLAHSGRKASTRPPWRGAMALDATDAAQGQAPWTPVGPSALAYDATGAMPRALDMVEIPAIVWAWRDAAKRARDAGFDVAEIHGAHGYLIHQFLSSHSNKRTDSWGGDLNGRMRLLLEIAEAVRAEWPRDRPVFMRLSILDEADAEWTLENAITVVNALKERGIDVIDCSSGGIGRPGFAIRGRHMPGYQIGLAEQIRAATKATVMAVGLITNGTQAEEVLQKGQADLVAIGREALADPHWALHAAIEIGANKDFGKWPEQYGWWLNQRERALAKAAEAKAEERR